MEKYKNIRKILYSGVIDICMMVFYTKTHKRFGGSRNENHKAQRCRGSFQGR